MFELTDKAVIVTGGTSGIGKATCYAVAKQGGKVCVVGRNEERGNGVVRDIEAQGGEAIFVQTDLTIKESIKEMVDKAVEAFGKLDCAVNNAGIVQPHMKLHEIDDDLLDKMLKTNLLSTFYCMKYEIPYMLENGKGAIVNLASTAAIRGIPNMCLYNATKAGVVGLTKGAALDYARKNIRVNSVCPGSTLTPIVPPEVRDGNTPGIPTGKWGKPEEIASLIVALISDELGNVTAENVVADNAETAIFGPFEE